VAIDDHMGQVLWTILSITNSLCIHLFSNIPSDFCVDNSFAGLTIEVGNEVDPNKGFGFSSSDGFDDFN